MLVTTQAGNSTQLIFFDNRSARKMIKICDDAQILLDLHNASFPSYKVPLSVTMSPNVSGDLVDVGGVSKFNFDGRKWQVEGCEL